MKLILASGSDTRAQMLRAAGVDFDVIKPRVDEQMIKASLIAEQAKPRDLVDALAEYKTRSVAQRNEGALVLGADQILVCEGEVWSKAETRAQARDHLTALRGRSHRLMSAAVIYAEGQPVWRHVGTADLTMRDVSDAFIDTYLNDIGDAALWSVGSYQIEGRGAQLFARVTGDYFSILGLPLIEVLDYLRVRGVIDT